MLVANSRLLVVNGLDVYALVCIFCFFAHPGWNCQDCIGKPGRCLNTIRSSLAQGVWHKMEEEEEIIVVSRTVLCVGEATFVPSPAPHAWMRPGPQRCAWCPYVGNNQNLIERHEIDHHGKNSRCPRFYCCTCGKAFDSSGALRKHARKKGDRINVRYAFPGEIPAIGGPAIGGPAIGGPAPASSSSTGPAIGGPEPADGGSTGPAIGGPEPALGGSAHRPLQCGLCPRRPVVSRCLTCGTWGCQGCIEAASGDCWACLGYGSPQEPPGGS